MAERSVGAKPVFSMRAKYLLAVLREKQTHSDGRVWYGHAVTYERIATWFGDSGPSARTLERWMAELRRAGAVTVKYARMRQGMRLQLPLCSARAFRHAQMSMFSEPVDMPRPAIPAAVEKTAVSVEKRSFPQGDLAARLRAACPQICGQKDLKSNKHVKRSPLAGASGSPPPEENGQSPKANGKTERREWRTGSGGMLSEYYALKRYLTKMPRARDPARYDRLQARWNALADEVEAETARRREAAPRRMAAGP